MLGKGEEVEVVSIPSYTPQKKKVARLSTQGRGGRSLSHLRRSPMAGARLLAILFNEEFFDELLCSENTETREELDRSQVVHRKPTWQEGAKVFLDPDRRPSHVLPCEPETTRQQHPCSRRAAVYPGCTGLSVSSTSVEGGFCERGWHPRRPLGVLEDETVVEGYAEVYREALSREDRSGEHAERFFLCCCPG
ncbi:unnamed protein product [Discosporangium mesarthrocarpum]